MPECTSLEQTPTDVSKVRIVGGTHRSRLIDVPDAIGLRPTPDRVRETLFNWLGQDLAGLVCLDLFAGSGALGFEAASRGAASVTMVEFAPRVMAHLRAAQARLQLPNVHLVAADAAGFVRSGGPYDLVLLDPPYRHGWLDRLAPSLPALLAPGAMVYVEAEIEPDEAFAGLTRLRQGRAGQVHYALFVNTPAGESA